MVPTPEDGRGNPEHRPVQPQTQLRLLMSPDLGKAQSLPACEGEGREPAPSRADSAFSGDQKKKKVLDSQQQGAFLFSVFGLV